MPTFEIGLDDGRKLHIDAVDQAAALTGVQHFLGQSAPAASPQGALSGLGTAAQSGLSNLVSGVGETANRYLGTGDAGVKAGQAIAPSAPAGDTTLYDKDGIHWGNIPRFLAENAPSTAAAMAAAKMAPGGLLGKSLAAGGVGLAAMAGNYAKDATAKRTGDANAPSNAQDLTAGLVRGLPEAAIQSLPFGRIAAPVEGAAARFGMRGVLDAGKAAVGDAASMAAAQGGSNVYDQLNQTGNVDPTQAINAAAGGGLLGGTLGLRNVGDAKAAIKNRAMASEDPAHVAEVANRLGAAHENLGGSLNNAADGGLAFKSVKTDVGTDLNTTLNALKGDATSPESLAALARAKKGIPLSDTDAAQLQEDTGNTQGVQDLQRLAGVSRVLGKVADTGYTHGDALTGGLSGALGSLGHSFSHSIGGGVLAGVGLGHFGLAMAPHSAAALGAAYGGARILDALSGSRSPAGAFAKRYGNSDIVAPPVGSGQGLGQLDQMAGQQPPPVSPTGPKIPPAPQPWANPPQQAQAPQAPPQQPWAPSPIAMRMLKEQMKNAPQAPQEPAAPPQQPWAPSPIAMRMLKAQLANSPQAQEPTLPLRGGNGPIDVPQFLNSRATPMQPTTGAPASISKSDGKVSTTPRLAPDPSDDVLAAARLQRQAMEKLAAKNGELQKGEAFQDIAQPKAVATTGAPTSIPEDLSIPDFLKRAPDQKVAATKAAAKMAGPETYVPVPEAERASAKAFAMTPEEHGANALADAKASGKYIKDDKAFSNFVKNAVTWKQDAATKLGSLFPKLGRDYFYHELLPNKYQAPIRQLRESLKALDPSKAAAVDSILANDQLSSVFKKVGTVRSAR